MEIQKGSDVKSFMTNGFLIWLNICAFPISIRKSFLIYDFATDPI